MAANARAGLKITGMKQGVKNPNRVNVFIDGAFSFSLDVSQVVDLGIKVGQEVDERQLDEFRHVSEFGKLYQRALEWVLSRPRSEKEVRDYLYRKIKNSSEDFVEFSNTVIARLRERGYLDDRRFAEFWVENRFVKKGVSRKRLKMELMKKGVASAVIEEVLKESSRDEKEEILKMIRKKRGKYDDEKLIAYLCRQGFSFELVREMVRSFGTD